MSSSNVTLGVIADTHDNIRQIRRAVNVFNQRKVDLVIHAGDFVAPFALAPFEELKPKWVGVLGNNDGDRKSLIFASKGRIHYSPYDLIIAEYPIMVLHELKPEIVREPFRLIVHGHTHAPEVAMSGQTLILNPGECCGWITGHSTIAVVETATWEPEIIDLPTG